MTTWHGFHDTPPSCFLDLGSGGGLPGLVLAERWACGGTLLDSMVKRISFLSEALEWEGAPVGVSVALGRAEELARESRWEGSFPLITVRSFGPPAVTAECAVRFAQVGGLVIVSEPPSIPERPRWDVGGLRKLGLEDLGRVEAGAHFQVLRKSRETPSAFPRPVGIPGRKPLF